MKFGILDLYFCVVFSVWGKSNRKRAREIVERNLLVWIDELFELAQAYFRGKSFVMPVFLAPALIQQHALDWDIIAL
jgi:hypothetical protein